MRRTLFFLLLIAGEVLAQGYGQQRGSISTTVTVGQAAQDSTGWQDNGTWIGLVAPTTDSVGVGARPLTYLSVYANPGGTSNILSMLSIRRSSTATPVANFAAAFDFYLESATVEDRLAARIISAWSTATDATRTSRLVFSTTNSGSTAEAMRLTPVGLGIGTSAQPTERLHVEGNVVKNDKLELFADAWTATGTNGAATGTLASYIPIYDFDAATAETLSIDLRVPSYFSSIDSIQLEVAVNSTAGDSIAFQALHRNIGLAEAYAGAFVADTLNFGPKDLGATANVMHRLSMTSAPTGIAADDRIIFKLWRKTTIANDVTADGRFVGWYVFGRGLK